MWNDGIRVIIPFWRTDVYGNALVNATIKNFQQLGGKVIDGVGYVPHTGDFSASLNRINFIIWDRRVEILGQKCKPSYIPVWRTGGGRIYRCFR